MLTLLYDDLLRQGKLRLDFLYQRLDQNFVLADTFALLNRVVKNLPLHLVLETWRNVAHEFLHFFLLVQAALSAQQVITNLILNVF